MIKTSLCTKTSGIVLYYSHKILFRSGVASQFLGGTRHHIGYNIRKITEAFYIMKEPLKEEGLLDWVSGSMAWLQNLGKILIHKKSSVLILTTLIRRQFIN